MISSADDRPTVLVVENEALLALAVEDALTDAGYRVIWRPNGHSALATVETGAFPSAAVVDLNLGHGMTGQEFISRLRERSAQLPVIVMTGYSLHGPKADLRGLGGPTARLAKPFEFDELITLLVWALKPADGLTIRCRRATRETGAQMPVLQDACTPLAGRSPAIPSLVVVPA